MTEPRRCGTAGPTWTLTETARSMRSAWISTATGCATTRWPIWTAAGWRMTPGWIPTTAAYRKVTPPTTDRGPGRYRWAGEANGVGTPSTGSNTPAVRWSTSTGRGAATIELWMPTVKVVR